MKKLLMRVAVAVAVGALILTGCPEDSSSAITYPFVCENGTPTTGTTTTENVSNCQQCRGGYDLIGSAGETGSACAVFYPYVCENGTVHSGRISIENISNCDSCISGFEIIGTAGDPGSTCGSIAYTCENGAATTGDGAVPGLSSCESCNTHYRIFGTAGTVGSTCSANTCFLVYGDATRTNCDQLALAPTDAFGQSYDGDGASLTFTEETTGGAEGSSVFRRLVFMSSVVPGRRENHAVLMQFWPQTTMPLEKL